MPTYDYRCTGCAHEFELFQKMSDRPKRKCPECGKNTLERLIGTGSAVLFKGSGFYETDYRSKSYKDAAKKDNDAASGGGKPESGSSSKDSGGSASKPAEKKKSESSAPKK